jgi:hypothetical protein
MKFVLITVVLFAFQFGGKAQCYMDQHNSSWFDEWASCTASPSPNSIRGNSHWIMYNFGEKYILKDLYVWNTNSNDNLDWGIQDALIDISNDGVNWTEYGTVTFSQGTGVNTYEGEWVADLNDIPAQYVLITAETNYGGACYGLSEIKIDVDNTVSVEEEDCFKANLYPNPFRDELKLNLESACSTEDLTYSVQDALGRVIVQETTVSPGQTVTILEDQSLVQGVYLVTLRSTNYSKTIRTIKY